MKQSLLIVVIVLMVVLVFTAVPASANGGPHGGYTATTDGDRKSVV